MSSCIFTNAFYFEKDLVDLPYFDGRWFLVNNSTNTTDSLVKYEVERRAKGYYFVHWKGGNAEQFMQLHTFKLDEQIFVDAQQVELNPATGAFNARLKVHTIWKYFLVDTSNFVVVNFNYDKVEDRLKDGKMKLQNTGDKGIFFVTAPTGELQKFLIDFRDNNEIWGEAFNFVKTY